MRASRGALTLDCAWIDFKIDSHTRRTIRADVTLVHVVDLAARDLPERKRKK